MPNMADDSRRDVLIRRFTRAVRNADSLWPAVSSSSINSRSCLRVKSRGRLVTISKAGIRSMFAVTKSRNDSR